MRHLQLVPALLIAACSAGGNAPPAVDAPPPPIDAPPDAPLVGLAADLEAIRVDHGLPALAAAVASPAGIVDVAAVGHRYLGSTAGVEPDDRWHLGSDTKAMTATLVAMAVEGGLLRWDTTLAEALPDLTDMHPDYRDVPIDWLLAHRAGAWTDFAPHAAELAAIDENAPVTVQRAMFAAIMLRAAPERTPGTAYAYSNAGYMVAGAILEAVYDRPWEQLITERLFTPLAMTSCGFGPPGDAGLVDEPWGHQGENLVPVAPDAPGADNPPILGPAGTVHCALADWAQFGTMQLGTRPELISAASLTRLHTSLGDDYALGWITGTLPQGRYVAHDGSNTLWYARIVVLLDAGRVLLVATNAGSTAAVAAVDDATLRLLEDVR